MKITTRVFFAALFTASLLVAQDPQPIPAEKLDQAVRLLLEANRGLGTLPLKLELAQDKAVGFQVEDVGAILIPDKRLQAKREKGSAKQNKGAAMPVGQLWTSKLSPKDKDSVLPNDKLRLVTVEADGKALSLAVYSLGIEKAGKKGFQLALYANDGPAVLRVPMTQAKAKGTAPVVMAARRTSDEGGVLELTLLGRFKAEIPVGKQAG